MSDLPLAAPTTVQETAAAQPEPAVATTDFARPQPFLAAPLAGGTSPEAAVTGSAEPHLITNTAGRDNSALSLQSITTGENSYVSVSIGGSLETRAQRIEHRAELSIVPLTSTLSLGALDVRVAVTQLRAQRVLVVECSWGDLQWSAVASLTAQLTAPLTAALGRIDDGTYADDPEAPNETRRNGWSSARAHGWSIEALTRHEACSAARMIVLELDGAAGSAQLDTYFASPGSLRALASALQRNDQYLLLLPRGRTRLHLSASRAHLGLNVPRLTVPFLTRWLHHRFPEHADELEALLRHKLERGDWEGEEALYAWLCTLPQELGATELRQALDDSGEPRPLQAVREALDRCDEKDEVFLTTIFVATYLPSLSQQEFSEAVRALLGDRTRKDETASHGAGASRVAELSFAVEWQRTARSVLKQADLELRERADGARVVAFRAAGASHVLKRELDAAPMFFDAQLEALQSSGLLFTARPALRDAVIDLLAVTCTSSPGLLTADWMIKLLGRRSLRAGASVPTEMGATPGEEWLSHPFLCTAKLLRRLLEVTNAGLPLVNGVLGAMMRRGPSMASAGLELAYHLRLMPGFQVWRWLHQALELPHEKLHRLARELIGSMSRDPAEAPEALEHLLEWLQREEDADDLGVAGKAAAAVLGSCLGESFTPVEPAESFEPEGDFHFEPILVATLEERATRAPHDGGLRQLLGVLARFMDIERLAPSYFATILLPPRLLAAMPEDVRARRVAEFTNEWRALREQHAAAWKPSPRRTALRLALLLAAWRLARPHQSELLRSLAAAARDALDAEPLRMQEWLGLLDELLSRCEAKVADDLSLTTELRRGWLQQSRERRHLLRELRPWLSLSPSPLLADPQPRKSAS